MSCNDRDLTPLLPAAPGMIELAADPARDAAQGRAGHLRTEQRFGLAAMVGADQGLYDRLLAGHRRPG